MEEKDSNIVLGLVEKEQSSTHISANAWVMYTCGARPQSSIIGQV